MTYPMTSDLRETVETSIIESLTIISIPDQDSLMYQCQHYRDHGLVMSVCVLYAVIEDGMYVSVCPLNHQVYKPWCPLCTYSLQYCCGNGCSYSACIDLHVPEHVTHYITSEIHESKYAFASEMPTWMGSHVMLVVQ